jgi:hypothetical protein
MILSEATPSPVAMCCATVEPSPARGEGAYAPRPPAARPVFVAVVPPLSPHGNFVAMRGPINVIATLILQ